MKRRYSAEIQRAKGLLEVAAALYDTSLSYQTDHTGRAKMADEVAYALCEAIEARKELIPTDNYRPLDMAQLCANDGEAPYDVPLHPGAERFYRERGYLK
jgi:TRAP-type uncharacterized transport system substrate-binding protein